MRPRVLLQSLCTADCTDSRINISRCAKSLAVLVVLGWNLASLNPFADDVC